MIDRDALTGLVLAGGQGRRMGGCDKGLEAFAGRPLIAHAVAPLVGRVAELLISANRHPEAYARWADRVVADVEAGYMGPLMGLYSGLRAAATDWVVVVPCDCPALPDDLVARLIAGRGDADIAVAHDGERLHPVVALIRRDLVDDLGEALAVGERKVERWFARHAWCAVDLSDRADAFANLNTLDDKRRMERRRRETPRP
ncbi:MULTISPECIES: molybdenum cofactor guanylyltransferase MobA [Halomonas]|uniref:Molybdenum cofactor guanylyltransferase n=1 Tax=Halomonas halophila TaxID=29573 RepID=A0ABQ0U6D6_9GAMM|nr:MULTISPECIES: molybdenum cofactor guanylyltransferase MobA [Halomonas]MDR5890923.1 molybdenum cofactor guanylyltransferase MobA [Halomonas salina]WJY05907.1 molybdenum cofactor guanylyltransferase MobA [Halomonas halophila]GEK74092.1 molybdenum cofactor guanylyltransferase [Halomonas halophila]